MIRSVSPWKPWPVAFPRVTPAPGLQKVASMLENRVARGKEHVQNMEESAFDLHLWRPFPYFNIEELPELLENGRMLSLLWKMGALGGNDLNNATPFGLSFICKNIVVPAVNRRGIGHVLWGGRNALWRDKSCLCNRVKAEPGPESTDKQVTEHFQALTAT